MIAYRLEEFGRPLQRFARALPEPQGRQVLLRVRACGVCHSDLHICDGHFDLGGGSRLDLARGVNPPRVLGHEIVGEVVATGPDARGIERGERVVVYPWIGCGTCDLCCGDQEHLCPRARSLGIQADGGFSDHVVVPDPRYLVRFDPVPAEIACTYACSGLTAFSALRKAGPLPRHARLLVIGAGGVGLSAIKMSLLVLGIAPLVADLDERKRSAALEAGATVAIDPSADDAARSLRKDTDGGVSAVIDFVGSGATIAFATGVVRKGGTIVVVGLFGGELRMPAALFALKVFTIVGSYVGSLTEMHELLALARAGQGHSLPTQMFPLSEANAVLDALRAGRIVGRAVLRP